MSTWKLDAPTLYAAVDTVRQHYDMSWRDVAAVLDVSASSLTRLSQGQRLEADALVTVLLWLNMPVRRFTTEAQPDPEAAPGPGEQAELPG